MKFRLVSFTTQYITIIELSFHSCECENCKVCVSRYSKMKAALLDSVKYSV